MVWFPTRLHGELVHALAGNHDVPDARHVLELTYLGLKHFRVPVETLRVMPVLFLTTDCGRCVSRHCCSSATTK